MIWLKYSIIYIFDSSTRCAFILWISSWRCLAASSLLCFCLNSWAWLSWFFLSSAICKLQLVHAAIEILQKKVWRKAPETLKFSIFVHKFPSSSELVHQSCWLNSPFQPIKHPAPSIVQNINLFLNAWGVTGSKKTTWNVYLHRFLNLQKLTYLKCFFLLFKFQKFPFKMIS